MKTIKIIDLLNKIAKGEEVPKKIFYEKQWWEYNPDNDYEGIEWGGCFLCNVLICELNDEVEIIEEEKEIEKLDYKVEQLENPSHNESLLMNMIRQNKETINKLIEELKRDK